MLSKAIAICVLVAIAAQLISAQDGLSELKAKLEDERDEIRANFRDKITENFLKPQYGVDKFMLEYYERFHLKSAENFKLLSVESAKLESESFAAMSKALDLVEKIYTEKYGQKFEVDGKELKFDADFFRVLVATAKSYAADEVFDYFDSKSTLIYEIEEMNKGKAYEDETKDLRERMLNSRFKLRKLTIDAEHTLESFCRAHHVESLRSLTKQLDHVIVMESCTDIRVILSQHTRIPKIVCSHDLERLIKEYVGPRLVERIHEVYKELSNMHEGKSQIPDILHVVNHDEDLLGDDFFFAKN